MPDWTRSMQQTFEYYVVNPNTWKDQQRLTTVTGSSITRDKDAETLGSATLDTTEIIDECYVRIYLVTIQNGIKEKHPLATVLVQSPNINYDGKINSTSLDAYTPLIELKENEPPLGYSVLKDENIMKRAYNLMSENMRGPVVETESDEKLIDDFVSNTDDTWLSFNDALIYNANYELGLDELGKVIFLPIQELKALQPIWTYNNDNSSILYPEVEVDYDIFGIPNVVEVWYYTDEEDLVGRAVNDKGDSPVSTVRRGREIVRRVINPDLPGIPSQAQVQEYAERLLEQLSTIERTISYKHAYCPVRLGDCVRLNYPQAGIDNIKAKVIYQSIQCEPGCPVSEKAVFSDNLWKG